MKRIIALLAGTVLLASQMEAAPREDREKKGRGPAAPAASVTQAREVPGHSRREATRAISSAGRSSATISPSSTQTAVTRSGSSRSFTAPTTSQTAIRSSVPTERSSSFVQRDSGDRQITTQRSSRFSPSTSGTYRYDRDYSDGRRYHRPPSNIYRSWDRDRIYSWNNNRYRWYGGTWVLYDAPSVVYSTALPVVGASTVAEVQAELRREGYYRGAVDGVLGPRTRGAIAAFQEDNGLAVTGRINNSLLRELGIH